MHVIILVVILSSVDSWVTDNFQLKLLGRCKNVNIFHWKFHMVEENKTILEGWGLTILEFGGHGDRTFQNFQGRAWG